MMIVHFEMGLMRSLDVTKGSEGDSSFPVPKTFLGLDILKNIVLLLNVLFLIIAVSYVERRFLWVF